jgi:progressive ankylosis protein
MCYIPKRMQNAQISTDQSTITQKQIFLLWIPLAAMWLFMGIEQPIINGIIARLSEAKENLAAFGVAFSLALILESPVIQLLAAGTALTKDRQHYRKLINFMHLMTLLLTGIHLVVGLTPLYAIITGEWMGVPDVIVENSRRSFLYMTPWSAVIGYRRLWQGILIRSGKTKMILYTIVARFIAIVAALFFLVRGGSFTGAEIAGFSLTIGVTAGGLAAYLYVRRDLQALPEKEAESPLTWGGLLKFYTPLALTSFIILAVRPIITVGLARAAFPLESLAVWPVIISLLFVFRAQAISFQEVVVSLLKKGGDHLPFKRFLFKLALSLAALFYLVSLSPLGKIWFRDIAGLDPELMVFIPVPLIIISILPSMDAYIAWFRGLLITREKTGSIAAAVGLNALVLSLIIFLVPRFFSISGVILVSMAYCAAFLAEIWFLYRKTR